MVPSGHKAQRRVNTNSLFSYQLRLSAAAVAAALLERISNARTPMFHSEPTTANTIDAPLIVGRAMAGSVLRSAGSSDRDMLSRQPPPPTLALR